MNKLLTISLVAVALAGCSNSGDDPVACNDAGFNEGVSALQQGNLVLAAPKFRDAAEHCGNEQARFLAAVTEGAKALIDDATTSSSQASSTPQARTANDLIVQSGGTISGDSSDVCALRISFPTTFPDDSPSSEEIRSMMTPLLLQRIDSAVADLVKLSGKFNMILDSSMLPSCLRASQPFSVEIDNGDVLAGIGALRTAAANLHLGSAYDVNGDIDDTINNHRTAQYVLAHNANLGNRLGDPESSGELSKAREFLEEAASDFHDAIASIGAETDDQADDLLVLERTRPATVDEARRALELGQQSLREEVVFPENEFAEISHDQRLNLSILFEGLIDSVRPLLPEFDSSGQLDPCHFPDPSFQDSAKDLTQADIESMFHLQCAT